MAERPLRYAELVAECAREVREIFPWDLRERLNAGPAPLLLDVREPEEFAAMHLPGSINVPRGILEAACDTGYEESRADLGGARERELVVICRSGYRSVLAAHVLGRMGYRHVASLKTGLRGWHDYDQALVNAAGDPVDEADADAYFAPRVAAGR